MVDLAALKEQLQEIINNLDEMKATEEDRTNLTEAVTILKRKVKEVSESQELRVTLPTQSIADALFRSVADKEEKQEEIQQCTNIKFFNGMPDSPYNSITVFQGPGEAGWKAAEAEIRAHIEAKTEEVRKIWLEDSDEELEDKEKKKNNVKNKKA